MADELPPVVAALTGDDASFLEMLERDIAALARFREDMQGALAGTGITPGSLGVGDGAAQEAAQAEESLAAVEEGAAAAQESMDRLAEATAAEESFFAELGAVSREAYQEMSAGATEATEAVEQLTAATSASKEEIEEAQFDLEGMRKAVDDLVATAESLQGAMTNAFHDVESGAKSAEQAVVELEAAITAAHTITAAQGAAMLGAAGTGSSLGALKQAAVTYKDAAAAAETYGIAEAQVATATRLLANADAAAADANTRLMQSYLMAANGAASGAQISSEAYEALKAQLASVADAESGVTAALAAQIDALNAVNLAVIRNDSELATGAAALAGLQASAEAAGIATEELAMQLETGQYKTLAKAAADADATLKAVALAEAEQRLAASQMTLLTAMADVAAGADMDAAQLGALRASVASAQADVAALGASAERTGHAMGGMGGGGMIAQMAIFTLASYVPEGISKLEQLSGVGDHTAVSVQGVESAMLGMSSSVQGTGENLTQLTGGLAAIANAAGNPIEGLTDINKALVNLQQTDPQLAAQQAAKVTAALEATGMSAATAAQDMSGYNDAVQASQIALAAQQHAVEDTIPGTQAYADAVQGATIQLEQQVLQSQENADAQQQWIDTVLPGTAEWTRAVQAGTTALAFQGQQAAIAADAQKVYLAQVVPGTQAYTYALDASQAALMSQASSARMTAQALNSLLPPTAQLSTETINQVQAFTEVQQATSEYSNALTALYGIYGNTTAAESAFTTDLANATGSIHSGKDAVDQYTKAGAANLQTFTQLSQQAQTVATDIYEQTGNAQQANTALQQMATQIDNLATKSGLSKKQVQQLNEELWGVKNIGSINIPINANTSGAENDLTHLLHKIDTSVGTVTVRLMDNGAEIGSVKGPVASKRAGGGAVVPGETYLIGEEGPELMQFGGNGFITPNDRIGPTVLDSGGGGGGGGGSGGGVTVIMQPGAIQAGVILGEDIALVNAIQQAMGNLGTLVPDQWASIQSTRGR